MSSSNNQKPVKAIFPLQNRNVPEDVIAKFERYFVCTEGHIYTQKADLTFNRLKLTPCGGGYLRLKVLDSSGNGYYFTASRLVFNTFCSDLFDQNNQIDHINRDRQDNRLFNLRCVTCQQNMANTSSVEKARIKRALKEIKILMKEVA